MQQIDATGGPAQASNSKEAKEYILDLRAAAARRGDHRAVQRAALIECWADGNFAPIRELMTTVRLPATPLTWPTSARLQAGRMTFALLGDGDR